MYVCVWVGGGVKKKQQKNIKRNGWKHKIIFELLVVFETSCAEKKKENYMKKREKKTNVPE